MARLPKEGQDVGQWGGVLNDFLLVGHNPDGTLKLSDTSTDVPDATAEVKGKLKLSGDLGGTADDPTVTSTSLSAALPIEQGGTGSSVKNFVDLSSSQTIDGVKSFSQTIQTDISGTSSNVTGLVAITNGGTGQTTAPAALNALLPNQTGHGTHVLTTDGTNSTWQPTTEVNLDDLYAMQWMGV